MAASARLSRASGSPTYSTGLRGRHGDHQRAGVGQADVLARVHDHAPGDVASVPARLQHPGEPEQGLRPDRTPMLLMNAEITS